MVRTRGLGRALARVIGRDMGREDEHDAVDVPQRCRPTASAHRQRVHVAVDEGVPQVTEDVPHMTDDVPQMSEDVPHMVEDVPHMTEDAPQMTADIDATVAEDLGRDGAEGSHADEGFPGGPRDPSVLTSFAIGELTIMLDDVSSLLYLPISGAFHGFEALVRRLEPRQYERAGHMYACHGFERSMR